MKISILSVAPPYRGGISEQTYHLSINLKNVHDVNIINFKRQYPNFLFPGETQYNEDSASHLLDNNYRLVDSINPFSWFKTSKFIKSNAPELVLLRFWNPFFAMSHGYIIKRIKKTLPDIKVISICDNIIPHEKNMLDHRLIKSLFKQIDGFIVMSDQVEQELLKIAPNSIYKKLFHPITSKNQPYSKETAKNKLNIKCKKVILFFGFIRDYKGLDTLIKANRYLKRDLNDYNIIICGECYGNKKKYMDMISKFSSDNEIKWIDQYLTEDLSAMYFAAADTVVLPYKNASQSGVIPLAYSYETPVIASDIRGIREMIENSKTGFLFERNNEKDLSDTIIKFYESDINYKMNIIKFREQFSWEYFTKEIFNLYKEL